MPDNPPPKQAATSPETAGAPPRSEVSNVDGVLFKNLVEIVPLVESLVDRRAKSCFTRRASVVYTPAPPQTKKTTTSKGGKTGQTFSANKRRDSTQQNDTDDDLSIFSSRKFGTKDLQKERKELVMLREQVNDLQRKLTEKDEALKLAEVAANQMNTACASIDELRQQVAEKDALIKSVNSQLYNAKITLADKQAALEKLTWESKMSQKKIEELEVEVMSMDQEMAALTQLYEKFCLDDSTSCSDFDATYDVEPIAVTDDSNDESEIQKLEEARMTYLAALSVAKENPSYESFATAADARLQLQALVIC